ncbi:hypothetical protein L1987_36124 [Smallanthus sonchifolius]|uniref:Uncharacterized protein n=1 Tax=Smallanthus sonchifolius TaxID=185202 RepID=A0ACB9HEB8_9ASTR|nr:hypothetical protein L1987_36124 [Smallanthus sonchifolius]
MILTPTIPTRNADSSHHRLLEAVKTALIKIFVSPYATVCTLCYLCVICIAEEYRMKIGGTKLKSATSSELMRHHLELEKSEKHGKVNARLTLLIFMNLIPALPLQENLEACLGDKVNTADIVCCMQHLQFCFETEEKVQRLLQNVSSLLKPGGYLLGITLDSSTIWAKYQKNVEAYHNRSGGMKANVVPNCIRSENYMITFEVEEEKFPFFGKKYQLKFANDASAETHCLVHFSSLIRLAREAGLEYVEIQNLLEFYDDNRAQFSGMLLEAGHGLVDPRGRLLPKFPDVLGLYTTFIFQKPDPDVAPPLMTPLLHEGTQIIDEREWQGSTWRDEEKTGPSHTDSTFSIGKITEQKGILGPGPADLRFSEAI